MTGAGSGPGPRRPPGGGGESDEKALAWARRGKKLGCCIALEDAAFARAGGLTHGTRRLEKCDSRSLTRDALLSTTQASKFRQNMCTTTPTPERKLLSDIRGRWLVVLFLVCLDGQARQFPMFVGRERRPAQVWQVPWFKTTKKNFCQKKKPVMPRLLAAFT